MTSRSEVDARLELVYQEAVRGLTHQQGVVESMNGRAGSLIFALWPYHNYRFRFDPQELLDRYVDRTWFSALKNAEDSRQ